MNRTITLSSPLATSGGTYALDVDRAEQIILLTGSGTLTGSWSIIASGTPSAGQTITIGYNCTFALGSYGISIFGVALTAIQASTAGTYFCVYNGSDWNVYASPSAFNTTYINGSQIVDSTVTGAKLVNSSVTNAKLSSMRRSTVKVGIVGDVADDLITTLGQILQNNGTDMVGATVSGDITLSTSGVATIGVGAVTNAKLASMARSTVKVGASGNVASDVAVGSGQMLIGNGSDVVPITPIGAITVLTNGVVVVNDSVINDANTTWYKDARNVYRGIMSTYVIEDGELKAYLNGTTQSLIALGAGDIILSCRLYISTPSGTGTDRINVGVDSSIRTVGALTNGFINDINANTAGIYASTSASGFSTYVGALGKIGYIQADGAGYITITSNANMTASVLGCTLVVDVLTK